MILPNSVLLKASGTSPNTVNPNLDSVIFNTSMAVTCQPIGYVDDGKDTNYPIIFVPGVIVSRLFNFLEEQIGPPTVHGIFNPNEYTLFRTGELDYMNGIPLHVQEHE